MKHSAIKHYTHFNNKGVTDTEFLAIEIYVPPWRGGSAKRGVSQLETFWIYELKSYFPYGRNLEWDINAFIRA